MELLCRFGGMRQPETGAMLGIDYSPVSIGRKRFLIKMEADPRLKSLFAKAKSRIRQGERPQFFYFPKPEICASCFFGCVPSTQKDQK